MHAGEHSIAADDLSTATENREMKFCGSPVHYRGLVNFLGGLEESTSLAHCTEEWLANAL